MVGLSLLSKQDIDDNYNIQIIEKYRIWTATSVLTCDSSMSSDASIFCNLYSNSIRRDSHDLQNVFRNETVFITKLLINAIVRFCCKGNI